MALVRRDCIPGVRGGGGHSFPQKDAWPDWGCRWPGEPSVCLWHTLPWPLPICLSVSQLSLCEQLCPSVFFFPWCSSSSQAEKETVYHASKLWVKRKSIPFPCSLLGHFLTAAFSSDTHSRKICYDSTRGGRVGIPGKTQLYMTENVIQHTQMAERTKINPEAVHYLGNPSLHLGKQGKQR